MSDYYRDFISACENKAFDKDHRKTLDFNISKYDVAVERGKKQFSNLELARERIANIKHRAINDLDKYLIEFEANFIARGGKVVWAQDEHEAIKEILKALTKRDAKHVVKSKSMITEEIELNEHLEKNQIESLETDLGEYIVQLIGEKPYHIITPVMHKSKEDVAEIFNKKFGYPIDSTPEQITGFVRRLLRDKFVAADAGVSGANFLIADTGSIALTENEGNGLMSVSFPKLHIVIAGIDKIIPSLKDLDLIWPMLAAHGTGQNITAYNTILSGPKQDQESDGPEEMICVLLDNRRTDVLEDEQQRKAFTCIRCGACINGCPVYRSIGGHAYGTTYSGPIGSVITPYMRGMQDFKHLAYASSLCGKCSEVCPAKISLHKLLINGRREAVDMGFVSKTDKWAMYVWKKAMTRRWLIEKGSPKTKNFLLRKFFSKLWGSRRDIPVIKEKSFCSQWKAQRGFKK